jgi:hypothetical protein
MNLPQFFLVNRRPVRFVANDVGGVRVEALDLTTRVFVPAPEYLTRCLLGDTDADEVDAAVFDARVAEICAP